MAYFSRNEAKSLGSLAYIADGAVGLQVIDVSDPYHPVVVGSAQWAPPCA